jgi:hypothetical protein
MQMDKLLSFYQLANMHVRHSRVCIVGRSLILFSLHIRVVVHSQYGTISNVRCLLVFSSLFVIINKIMGAQILLFSF